MTDATGRTPQDRPSGLAARSRAAGRPSVGRGLVRQALAEGLLRPAFQPLVELESGRVFGYEALARIRRDGVVHAAGTFVQEAEEEGLLAEVDRAILQAVADCASHPLLADKLLFVNLSPQLLADEAYRRAIRDTLAARPDLASRTVLEITERQPLPDGEDVSAFLRGLKGMGVRLALDDFGSGYSFDGYLKGVPVDYVKVAGVLVRDLARSPRGRRLVARIHRLAGEMGAVTLGEWVEDAETADALRGLGVRLGQGYHLGHPRLFEDLVALPA